METNAERTVDIDMVQRETNPLWVGFNEKQNSGWIPKGWKCRSMRWQSDAGARETEWDRMDDCICLTAARF